MFKYLGQHIFDFVSKFRNDVYFQNLEELEHNFSIVVGPDGKLAKSKGPAEKSIIEVRNDEGSVIPAGAPLYSKGEIGGSDRIKVGICDASDPAKMPCIGIAQYEMNTSDTKDNFAITQGVYNTNISGFTGLSEGDTLYVNGGAAPYLTSTKPSNGSYIQNVGIVLKTNGTICQGLLVSAIGRTNDVPWPLYVDVPNGKVGIGTTSPQYITDIQSPNQTNNIPAGDDVYNIFNVGYSNSNFNIANKSVFTVGATAQSSGRFVTELRIGGGSNTSPHFIYYGNGYANGFRLDRSNNNLVLFNNVQGNGVVIKQTPDGLSSSARLQVRGDGTTSSTTSLLVENSNGSASLIVKDDRNVGIGTPSPTEKLDVVGNIKASGTIKGKMEQMFACSFNDDLGTTKHYIPFTSNAEQTNVHADQVAMVMPYGGRVKCIQMRLPNIDADTTRTFGIESIGVGINMFQASNNWTVEETEAYELLVSDNYYLVNYVFSNETHFDSGDLLAISIQDTEDAYTASRPTYVTVIIEYDLNNGMGNDTATTKYTS